MMKHESKRSISIEDLLRLKRAERPPAEFWNEFDRALRAKQLAALVEKRPWWRTMPRMFAGLKLYHIPIGVGASAAIAVTFLSLRDHAGRHVTPAPPSISAEANLATAPAALPAHGARTEAVAAVAGPRESISYVNTANAAADVATVTTLASEATAPGELSRMIPLLGGSAGETGSEELSPSARAIAANLASVRGSEPVLASTLLSNSGTELRVARMAVEPLQQITPPADRRRSNLMTAMVTMAAYQMPQRGTEHTSSQPSQDELNDRIHRFAAKGAGVSMKF
jgi:hypothetical protein